MQIVVACRHRLPIAGRHSLVKKADMRENLLPTIDDDRDEKAASAFSSLFCKPR